MKISANGFLLFAVGFLLGIVIATVSSGSLCDYRTRADKAPEVEERTVTPGPDV